VRNRLISMISSVSEVIYALYIRSNDMIFHVFKCRWWLAIYFVFKCS